MIELDISGVRYNELIPPDDLTNEEYHKSDGISASGLKQAWKDPKLYHFKDKLKRIKSPALEMGTALHEAVLERDNFDIRNYRLTPANQDKLLIMINNAKVMFDYIVKKTLNEYSLFVQDEGFVRKCRVDAYDKDNGIVYDLKTTRYNSPSMFMRDFYEYGYHLQAAFYLDTLRLAGFKADYFAFLVVPSDSPCDPFAMTVTDRFIEDGRETYTEVLENILNYKKQGGYQVYFREVDLPTWRLKQLGEIE